MIVVAVTITADRPARRFTISDYTWHCIALHCTTVGAPTWVTRIGSRVQLPEDKTQLAKVWENIRSLWHLLKDE